MNRREKEALTRLAGGKIRFGCAMSQLTTFRVGGDAEALYEAQEPEDLGRFMAYLYKAGIPYLVVGRGSNLLVKDEGVAGVVILLSGSLATAEMEKTNHSKVLAGAGLPISDFLIYCRHAGLGGLEFLAGIPGTVGGAVTMNAGAYGGEVGSRVKELECMAPQGHVTVRNGPDLPFSYRKLELERGSVILRVRFNMRLESEKTVADRMSGYLKKRRERQPLEYPSAGSVFRNPPNNHAGRLIEEAGLKGERIGGAMISKKHANFIVNTGGATARDILALLSFAQEKVQKATGIKLEPEIRVVGG
ncbi:MAG: UDP-N-acetylmuramate dehydrogenase [Deltaproteobacteria bacterium]|nr:UDP-N-acetylmuramate dehydrogenase [Deltaproteobacteria bacterium]